MREGFERNYIIDLDARSFSNMLEKSRKHTLAVEAGTEKLFRETENLKMGAQIGQTLQKVDQFDAVDVRGQEIKQAKEEEAAKEAEKEKEQEQEVSFSYDDQNDQTLNEEEMRKIIDGDADLSRDISTDRGRSLDDELISSLFGKNGENISRSDSIKSQSGAGSETEYNDALTDKLMRFNTERSAVFMGRESREHKDLRMALAEMQDARIKAGFPMKADQLLEYMEKLDEFIRVRFNNVINLNNTGQMIGYYNYVAQFYK